MSPGSVLCPPPNVSIIQTPPQRKDSSLCHNKDYQGSKMKFIVIIIENNSVNLHLLEASSTCQNLMFFSGKTIIIIIS